MISINYCKSVTWTKSCIGAPETKAAEEKLYRQKQIGEFMTTWKDFPRPGLAAWAERQKAGLMGTAKAPVTRRFRPFDRLSIPNQSLVILENDITASASKA